MTPPSKKGNTHRMKLRCPTKKDIWIVKGTFQSDTSHDCNVYSLQSPIQTSLSQWVFAEDYEYMKVIRLGANITIMCVDVFQYLVSQLLPKVTYANLLPYSLQKLVTDST